MRRSLIILGVVLVAAMANAEGVRPGEIEEARRWIKGAIPFSFQYGGRPSTELLKDWDAGRASKKLDESRTEYTLSWKDAKTGLTVRCVAVEYSDFPTIEWTLYLKNTGSADSPIISDIQALDMRVDTENPVILHHHAGTLVTARDFEPHETVLEPGDSMRFAPPGGRPLGVVFPYFNIEFGGRGAIAVIGWPGQWSAQFDRDEKGLSVRAGQELTHFKLHPGEEVRSPLIVLQFWVGDRIHAQNVWRRWMIAHNLPRYGGKLPQPQMPAVSGNHFPGLLCNEADEIRFIDGYVKEGIRLDYWWMDAGWYPNKGDWTSTGTWEVDRTRFPGGHRNDLETMRRAVPLLRSDYIFDPVGEQGHTYGLAFWLPYYGTGFINFDTYIFRSTMCPNTTLGPDVRRSDIDWPLLRKLIAQWRKVADYYYGDYYPLTPYSLESNVLDGLAV